MVDSNLVKELGKCGLRERLGSDLLVQGVNSIDSVVGCFDSCEPMQADSEKRLSSDYLGSQAALLYNAIGSVYPCLSSTKRQEVVRKFVQYLDSIRNREIARTWNVRFVHEPTLVADIVARNRDYWPGFWDAQFVFQQYIVNGFASLKNDKIGVDGLFKAGSVLSDFRFAYNLLRSKNKPVAPNSPDFGTQYAGLCHRGFLQRVIDAVVLMRILICARENVPPLDGLERLEEVLPKNVHSMVKYCYNKPRTFDFESLDI